MAIAAARSLTRRLGQFDLWLCLWCNRAVHRRLLQRGFALVSRLGDGVFWYSLMAVLPLARGRAGLATSLHMALVGLIALLLYRGLKRRCSRPRPAHAHPGIHLGTAPLDLYSFPSGHTLHAVAFTAVALAHFPALFWVLVPFTALVALSRVILGLHYPSDVLAGATIGAALAGASFLLPLIA